LLNYHYPGNVRELENILEHALIICQGDTIQLRHLPEYLQSRPAAKMHVAPAEARLPDGSTNREREKVIAMLQQHNWHRSKTARALGMDRTTLWRKIKKYGLER